MPSELIVANLKKYGTTGGSILKVNSSFLATLCSQLKGRDNMHNIRSNIDLLFNIESLWMIALQPRIVDICGNYFGCSGYVSNIQYFRTYLRGKNNDYGNELKDLFYHRDNHGSRVLKLFIPLNTLGQNQGNHYYIKSSHSEEFFDIMKLRNNKGDCELLRKMYYEKKGTPYLVDNKLVEDYLSSDVMVIPHQYGVVTLEDTTGFHRGSALISEIDDVNNSVYRDMLIVTYLPEYNKKVGLYSNRSLLWIKQNCESVFAAVGGLSESSYINAWSSYIGRL